jgi:hypothetical protein
MTLSSALSAQLPAASAHELDDVLRMLVADAERVLGSDLVGVYLTGSFALGHGDLASDVDFLVVSARELTPDDERGARAAHAVFPDRPEHFARHLEGSWVSRAALASAPGETGPWLYVDNGSSEMEHSRHDDSWTSRWVARRAIPVVGPDPNLFVAAPPQGSLRREAREQSQARVAWLDDHQDQFEDGWAQPYLALTFSRLLYSAHTDEVTGKAEAARWVIEKYPRSGFEDLITRSITHRLDPFDRVHGRADPALSSQMAAFVSWAHYGVTAGV